MISFVFTVFTFQIHCTDMTEKCLVISAGEKKKCNHHSALTEYIRTNSCLIYYPNLCNM